MTYDSRTADKFVVRLPNGMREQIAEVARQNNRSMNSEIVRRIATSLASDGVDDQSPMLETGEEIDWIPQIGQLVVAQGTVRGTIEDIACDRSGEGTIKLRGISRRYAIEHCSPIKLRRVAHAR